MRRIIVSLWMAISCWFSPAWSQELTVAVAANFSAPAQKIATAFTATSGHKVQIVIGSTGKLYAQIKNGAPFHILLAADNETPARLVKEGVGVVGSQFTYAVGRLVLWSKQPGLVDVQGAVLRSNFERLAIADPKVAPYGAAALEVLDKLQLRSQVQARLVQGESIAQAYQFVHTGNAALGLVALSQVMVDGRVSEGSAWVVPATLHSALEQDGVLLQSAQANVAAHAFMTYLKSAPAQALIRSHGYEL